MTLLRNAKTMMWVIPLTRAIGKLLVPLALLAAPPIVAQPLPSAQARAAQRLAVLDFELEGDDGGAAFAAAHHVRLAFGSDRLRKALTESGLFQVVDNSAAQAMIDRSHSMEKLHRCNGCERDIAKALRADLVLTPWIYRVSNLVLVFNVAIRDVSSGEIVFRKALDFRGDNDESWDRAIGYLMRDLRERRAANKF